MKTFVFKLTFTCPYTMENRSRLDEYRAQDKQTAVKGMIAYCSHNKNMLNATSELIKQL